MGKMIGAAEFKAHCARIIAEIDRTGEGVTVTVRGRPVVEVKPVEKPRAERPPLFGFMKGKGMIRGDIVGSPLDPDWEEQWEKKWEDRGYVKR
jgi:prevent-host-death family protein